MFGRHDRAHLRTLLHARRHLQRPGTRRQLANQPIAGVDVPSAITTYPRDIEKYPRPWAQERFRQIVRWESPDAGGHFPSLEVPDYFVKDLREGLAAVLAADR
jgi:hypothetical protein